MVSKGFSIKEIFLTELIVFFYRDFSKLATIQLVLTGIVLGNTLYHDDMIVVSGLHPHLSPKSTHTAVDESTIFFHGVHKVLWLVKCCMTRVHVDHELLVGRSDRDEKSLPRREPSSDIFRRWGVEEQPLVGMFLAFVVTTNLCSRPRCMRSQDEV